MPESSSHLSPCDSGPTSAPGSTLCDRVIVTSVTARLPPCLRISRALPLQDLLDNPFFLTVTCVHTLTKTHLSADGEVSVTVRVDPTRRKDGTPLAPTTVLYRPGGPKPHTNGPDRLPGSRTVAETCRTKKRSTVDCGRVGLGGGGRNQGARTLLLLDSVTVTRT